MNVTVVFDGQCGMCTRTVRKVRDLDRRHVLTFRPCQSIPAEGWRGVWPAQCERAVVAVADDGTIAVGSDAAMLILSAMTGSQIPYRVGTVPGIRHVLQAGYRLIANNRRRFPGETPWCQQHPEECA